MNRYWRSVAGRVLISREGRAYRDQVAELVRGVTLTGRLALSITACPPDRRRRDLDNLLKAPLDAMQAAGVYADDEQIDRLTIERGPPTPGGRLAIILHGTVPAGGLP